jgi:hypothetical protein
MSAFALRNTVYSESRDSEFDDEEVEREEFFAGERICPPRPRRTALSMLLSWLIIPAALYGGWTVTSNPPAWLERLSTDITALWYALNPKDAQPAQQETATATPPPAATEQPIAETEIADAPGAEAGTAVPAVTVETAPVESTDTERAGSDEAAAAPAPQTVPQQPSPPRTDRYEKQAEAVGLNPDLSKAVLKRLTETDFRNAGVAIKTALAKTADDAVHTWPTRPKTGLALFEVRFVPGAAETCRRYVVTVTKDRWATTAPPMEKCGLSKPAPGPAPSVAKASAG